MTDPIRELKIRADVLQRGVEAGTPSALARLVALPELRQKSLDELALAAAGIQRKHCLGVVAREAGFDTWLHAVRVLDDEGEARPDDFGTLLYRRGCGGFLNVWFSSYDEARAHHEERGGYLLAYRRHFFVVEAAFIEALGLDPDDADWAALERDWAMPRDRAARRRLYGKLLARPAHAA